ncbi:hypothetical protein BKA56DRAFT_26853 [Ilyonectria sp. MPI-CAGE-AT-0026]|nr:hypothetical protein BKA56DRAFT_26853 [Ilyonectria sp. MPI-CAGE-AT-0026]
MGEFAYVPVLVLRLVLQLVCRSDDPANPITDVPRSGFDLVNGKWSSATVACHWLAPIGKNKRGGSPRLGEGFILVG